jgi:hypothetical protein
VVIPKWRWVGAVIAGSIVLAPMAAAEGPPARRPVPAGASPAGTLLRSIAFPGWGQLENHRPFKAATIFAVETGLLASGFVEYRRSQTSRDDEQAAAIRGDAAAATRSFDQYVDRRDRAINRFWWAAFTMMMSMIDAYTDAHLRDFVRAPVPDVEPDADPGSDPGSEPGPPRPVPSAPAPGRPSPKLELGADPLDCEVGIVVRF